MIYSAPSLVALSNPCADGAVRTREALDKYGWNYDTPVTADWCLDELTLHDTIYSLGYVFAESEAEAKWVLQKFGAYILKDLADTALKQGMSKSDIMESGRLVEIYLEKSKDKASLMRIISAALTGPHYIVEAYRSLLAHGQPLHLRVLHASLCLAKFRAYSSEYDAEIVFAEELQAQTAVFRTLLESANAAFGSK